ncbi:DUF302 domain-containing protein (plasmid) [Skermanella mucosa]|uniref:DUF302 domain-containing protein n=1 Tax=Skermanella mucosa TaxID=1789672 RepID=UPI001E2FFE59|nr:DUF302 domain-containing protein [Skermanella mucosa]UEM25184.1 DUF302 domain-containing protein [Skermanella mucosa]
MKRAPFASTLFASTLVALTLVASLPAVQANAQTDAAMVGGGAQRSGTVVIDTDVPFTAFDDRLRQAIKENRMGIVAEASATRGAQSIGVTIPGNAVIMVYRPDFAVRMLKASVPAGIEAPLRLYLTEADDGTATLTYRKPSSVFAPYGNAELDSMAGELDGIFAKIVADAQSR